MAPADTGRNDADDPRDDPEIDHIHGCVVIGLDKAPYRQNGAEIAEDQYADQYGIIGKFQVDGSAHPD